MTTNGVRLVSEVTWSTSPTQKIKVTPMMKARIELVPNAINNEYGIVFDASFAFSAGSKVSHLNAEERQLASRKERTHMYRTIIPDENTPCCKNTNESCSSGIRPPPTIGESKKDVRSFATRRQHPERNHNS